MDRDAALVAAEKRIEELATELGRAENEAKRVYGAEIDKLEEQLTAAQAERDALRKRVEELENTIRDYALEVSTVKQDLSEDQRKLTAAQAENARIREALENLLDRWRKCGAEKTTSFAIVEKALKGE